MALMLMVAQYGRRKLDGEFVDPATHELSLGCLVIGQGFPFWPKISFLLCLSFSSIYALLHFHNDFMSSILPHHFKVGTEWSYADLYTLCALSALGKRRVKILDIILSRDGHGTG